MSLDTETVSFFILAAVLVGSGLASSMVKRTFHSVMFLGVFLVSIAGLYILLGSPLVGIIQILVYVGGILTLFVFAVMFVAGDEAEVVEAAPVLEPRSSVWGILTALAVAAVVFFLAVKATIPANHAVAGLLGGHSVTSADGKVTTWTASTLAASAGFVAGLLAIVVLALAGIVAWFGIRHAIDRWSGTRMFGTALAALILGILLAVVTYHGGPWGDSVGTDANQTQANDLERVVDALFGPQSIAFELLGILLTAVMIGALVIARPLLAPADDARYAKITSAQLLESQRASDVALHTDPGVAK